MNVEDGERTRLTAGSPQFYRLRADSDIGGEVYERMLLERLPRHGIDVVVGLPGEEHGREAPAGWQVDLLPARAQRHWTLAPYVYLPYARRLLRERRVDLLRGPSVRYTGPSLLLARSSLRSRVPVVLHHHHFTPRWQRLEAAILRRCDAVITVSEHSRQALVRAGLAPGRVHAVLQGVDRPEPTRGAAELWPEGSLRLLCLGRAEARKRPELAIEALARLRGEGVAASLVVAGEGPRLSALVELSRAAGMAAHVRFLGRVCEELKWRLYDSADVVLFGSALEGFGLVVAEAQSRGVPVVAARGTATAEALQDGITGRLSEPDAAAFAAAVRELEDPRRRSQVSARAREFARRFDWDRCAGQVAEIYRDVVRGRPALPSPPLPLPAGAPVQPPSPPNTANGLNGVP